MTMACNPSDRKSSFASFINCNTGNKPLGSGSVELAPMGKDTSPHLNGGWTDEDPRLSHEACVLGSFYVFLCPTTIFLPLSDSPTCAVARRACSSPTTPKVLQKIITETMADTTAPTAASEPLPEELSQREKTEMLADEDPLLISQSLTYVTDDGSVLHSFQSAPFSTGRSCMLLQHWCLALLTQPYCTDQPHSYILLSHF